MIYITGATDGNEREWITSVEPMLHPGDTIIIAGSFGHGKWRGPLSEDVFYDRIEAALYTVLFVDGLHDDTDRLSVLPVEEWRGGKVHRVRSGILHLMRGEIFDIGGSCVFVLGGGPTGRALTEAEYRNAEENLRKLRRLGRPLDAVITQTAPPDALCALSAYGDPFVTQGDRPLLGFLERVDGQFLYQRWYFGRYPVDAELWGNRIALHDAVRELGTGLIVGWKSAQ